MKHLIKIFLIAIVLVSSLTSCAPALVGGAAVAGLTILDRRSAGTIADDNVTELKISTEANNLFPSKPKKSNKEISIPTIRVISYNRSVLFLGLVENENQKRMIEQIAKSQPTVKKVYNYIDISDHRTMSDYANDTWINSKVRAVLLNPKGFSPNHVKVITYGSVTYVLGILTPEEQDVVVKQISVVPGVTKVVTLFETFVPN